MKLNRPMLFAAVAALVMVGAPVAAHRGGHGGPGSGPGGPGGGRGCAGQGNIVSVDEASLSFVVQPKDAAADPVTVVTTDATTIVNSDGTEAAFSDLAEGLRVGVKGTVDADTGVVTAEQVVILLEAPGSRPCSGGTVTSVDASTDTFTATGGKGQEDVIVTVTDDTVITTIDGTAATFDQIVVGAKVKVTGTVSDDGIVTADTVVIQASKATKKAKKGRR